MNQIKSYTDYNEYNPTGDWDAGVVSLYHLPRGAYLVNLLHWNINENTETVIWVKDMTAEIKYTQFRYKPFWGGGFSGTQHIIINNNDTQLTGYVRTPGTNTHTYMTITAVFLHDIE
jgi:hypothetical protein